MKISSRWRLFASLTLAFSSTLGHAIQSVNSMLDPSQVPDQVCKIQIIIPDNSIQSKIFQCSGTLVAPDKILTAGHCIKTMTAPGATTVVRCGQEIRIGVTSELWLKKEYFEIRIGNGDGEKIGGSDIGYFKLEKKMSLSPIPPASEAEKILFKKTGPCAIFGFGQYDSPKALGSWTEFLWPSRDFYTQKLFNPTGLNRPVVADPSTTFYGRSTVVVPGDSGGPVLCQTKNEEWRVMGVISANVRQFKLDGSGIYENAVVTEFHDSQNFVLEKPNSGVTIKPVNGH